MDIILDQCECVCNSAEIVEIVNKPFVWDFKTMFLITILGFLILLVILGLLIGAGKIKQLDDWEKLRGINNDKRT